MATLTVGGVDFDVTSWEEIEPRQRGEVTVSFNNTLRSSVSSEKRQFRGVTFPVSKTKYDSLQTAIANRATVTVTGDVMNGASLSCKVTASYSLVGIGTADAGYNFQYAITLNVSQV